ncbi:MAG: 3-deoxy-manno-octulosonate cytidylyltransferase [Candidatus Cloacimonetes bacterium]|nr:3-deoxy-manno-octulosonate cytidylyltransferase [Candidatus Cloacimonadota bacterium]MCF7813235.1 3-deoxy-manno-octulosonate cytidylyltransferase [Candidatus Cloacimonadota bacterium]MCF7867434.1 3-deoxy-manno-octulosonate cytidylyltransferase [Candidatus Cloacimonadota bacterium]MCF7882934.1 3-deoxy-manno-octulosonate cytidylyltransferase [Candidatus Cloacimonadota bacterium]
MKAIAIIPARYDSNRFPGKLLAKLGNKPIIQHVYERAVKTGLFDCVVVGTDDQRIYETVDSFGGKVSLTSKKHQSGTDRIAEVCLKLECCKDADIVVNIQGDEPFISSKPLRNLIASFDNENVQVASLMHEISKDIENLNKVKVVCDKANFAFYFSRSVIPFDRDKNQTPQYYKHVGVYAFRREMLFKFVDMPKSKLEEIEKLEQLRLLENGIRIKMIETEYEGIGIDTPEDLEKAEKLLIK